MSDDWRQSVAARLLDDKVAEGQISFAPNGATALEIAFGQARSEVSYVLEFARAHGVPATGNVIGDDVALKLGDSTLRFKIDRLVSKIRVSFTGRDDDTLSWDDARKSLARGTEPVEMQAYVREAIDTAVGGLRTSVPPKKARASTVRDLPAAGGDTATPRDSGNEKDKQ